MKQGKAKLFNARKDLDGQFHRGGGGRSAAKARAHKRGVERRLRQHSKNLCRNARLEE
jgi:hypothetical protein